MARVGGDEDLLRELTGDYLRDAPVWRDDLRQAVARGDAAAVRRAAHTIKGAVGYFGADEAGALADRLQELGRAGDMAGASRRPSRPRSRSGPAGGVRRAPSASAGRTVLGEPLMNPQNSGAADAVGAEPVGPDLHTVLVVDDSAMDRRLAGAIIQKAEGWKAVFAGNGVEALELIPRVSPDVVLTDMLMPQMDGLELVEAVRAKYPLTPVILMTAHGSEDLAIRALKKGAASYVPKQSLAQNLAETLDQVFSAAQTKVSERRILDTVMRSETQYEIENDAAMVAPLVSHLEGDLSRMGLCEPSGLMLLGVALHEALTNSIFHGNLELKSEQRETDEKGYYRMAKERRYQEPYRDRRVRVVATLTRDEATFVVRDEGLGFDPSTLPDPTDPANLGKVSGRGLLLIQTFMDHVEHNATGNQITMVMRRSGNQQ